MTTNAANSAHSTDTAKSTASSADRVQAEAQTAALAELTRESRRHVRMSERVEARLALEYHAAGASIAIVHCHRYGVVRGDQHVAVRGVRRGQLVYDVDVLVAAAAVQVDQMSAVSRRHMGNADRLRQCVDVVVVAVGSDGGTLRLDGEQARLGLMYHLAAARARLESREYQILFVHLQLQLWLL